jgi:hypothetical protein
MVKTWIIHDALTDGRGVQVVKLGWQGWHVRNAGDSFLGSGISSGVAAVRDLRISHIGRVGLPAF